MGRGPPQSHTARGPRAFERPWDLVTAARWPREQRQDKGAPGYRSPGFWANGPESLKARVKGFAVRDEAVRIGMGLGEESHLWPVRYGPSQRW